MIHTGEVLWFDDVRGYGFLKLDDGSDAFVHRTSIEGGEDGGYRTLSPGQSIRCELTNTSRGLKAVKVRA